MKRSSLLYLLALAAVAAFAWYLSNYHYQLLLISGESMSPAYHSGQLTLVDRAAQDYAPGDVVLFYCEGLERNLVKRIAAVPGDSLYAEGGQLYINAVPVAPLPEHSRRAGILTDTASCVPDGWYFLLGDNLAQSTDSRYQEVGLVPREAILGRLIR